jgi:hypothetical protein
MPGWSGEEQEDKENHRECLPPGHADEDLGEHVESECECSLAGDPGDAEEDERGGHRDESAQAHLAKLVRRRGRETREHHVVAPPQVTRVGDDHSEADREGEEDLSSGREPELRVAESLEHVARVPQVAEAVQHRLVGLGRIRRAEGEDTPEDDQRDHDQGGHRVGADLLDPLGNAAVDEDKIEDEDDDQEDPDIAGAKFQRDAVLACAGEGREELAEVQTRLMQAAGQRVDCVAQAPCFDVHVVHVDQHRGEESDHAQVSRPRAVEQGVEDARRGVEPAPTTFAAEGPLDPAERQADDEQ